MFVILFLVSLVLAAFLRSAETAFISMQKLRLEHLVRTGRPGARAAARIFEKPEKLLATVLLSVNFFETAMATLGTVMAISLWNENLGTAIATIVITVITVVLVELIPKVWAARHSERLALLYARPVEIISLVLYPFVWVLNHIGLGVQRLTGEVEAKPTLSEAEFHTAIEVGQEEGVVEEKAAEMLHNVFEFGNRPVREVMVPRPEVIAIEKGSLLSGFLEQYSRFPLSRIPVYEGSMDKVVGILSVKDVLMAIARGTVKPGETIDSLMREPYFVPETKPISDLFIEMRDNNYHMAIVVDEFGGTAGAASLTRLIEEIVGPVGDEISGSPKDFEIIDEHTFQIDGGMRVEAANEEMSLGLPEGDYETVAGFILNLLGRFPKQGEQLKYHNLKIVITRMRGLKIEEVLVSREKTPNEPKTPNAAFTD